MKVLFLTLYDFRNMENQGIYEDLLREFIKHGHQVYVISPAEKRNNISTQLISKDMCHILKVKTGNITKTHLLEKGISTVLLERQFKKAIIQFWKDVRFDLVMYSTPPITLVGVIQYLRKRNHVSTYLLLKDIFPQNAVDLGMVKKRGLIYNYFRKKEKDLYKCSDRIGCMSKANVEYLLSHNSFLDEKQVEICPNSVEIVRSTITSEQRGILREKYGIPVDETVFVYGGNLGKPQGIPFIIECLNKVEKIKNVFFLIVGSGTEYGRLEEYISSKKFSNVKLLASLPKSEYELLIDACDVGVIFLDYSFTIPNFPSRLLSYMQAGLPVLASTDPNTDVGSTITEGGFGWWCPSNDSDQFVELVKEISETELSEIGLRGREYLVNHYTTKKCYDIIMGK